MLESVFTSLIAAIVFWLASCFMPDRYKYRKMRPLVEDNIKWISFYLLQYLQCAVLHNRHTASFYQSRITSGDISEEDYNVFLNTKCLNESYHLDENSSKMLIVGDKLQKFTDIMLKRIDTAYRYTQYTKTEEFCLLEEISKRITYMNIMTIQLRLYKEGPFSHKILASHICTRTSRNSMIYY